jgi:hypothetical protein
LLAVRTSLKVVSFDVGKITAGVVAGKLIPEVATLELDRYVYLASLMSFECSCERLLQNYAP